MGLCNNYLEGMAAKLEGGIRENDNKREGGLDVKFNTYRGGVKGGLDHFSRGIKTVLSLFTKIKDKIKITVHGELNIYFSFHAK